MRINALKTKVMSVHIHGEQRQAVLLDGEPLEDADKFKYQQLHSLLCISITPPEDELHQQHRKIVNKHPCSEEAFYLQIFYSGCLYTR